MRRVNKPWGYELIWAENPKYLGKVLHIMAGSRLSLQYHRVKDETIMVQEGTLKLEYGTSKKDIKEIEMNPGDTFHISPGLLHRMSGVTDTKVIEVSTSEIADVVRVEDDHGRVKNFP
jgi:mannose-6-phosphate isomerase-like protein (cupin superfamily)